MRHYFYSELDALHHGSMGKVRSLLCRVHLLHCPECHARYMRFLDDEKMLAELRQVRSSNQLPENPTQYERLSSLFHHLPDKQTLRV